MRVKRIAAGNSTVENILLVAVIPLLVVMGFTSVSHAQTIVYQDTFDNDGLGVNAGIGGGIVNRTFQGHSWSDNGDLNFNTSGTQFQRSAIAFSMNSFQSNEGFELSVDYADFSFGAAARRLSFGLVSSATDLATYTPFNNNNRNPFGGDPNLYSLGLTIREGLRFLDGTSVTTLDTANVQAGSAAFISILNDGMGGANWSYLIDGVNQASGNIAAFDFALSYQFVAYGQDNDGAKSIQSVLLAMIDPVVPDDPDDSVPPPPILQFVDAGAINQLVGSAIPTNIAVGQIASQVHGVGLRDLNKRLTRLRRRIGSGAMQSTLDQGGGREVAASRFHHLEGKLKINSTIHLDDTSRSSNPESPSYESFRLDDRNPMIPSVNVPASGGVPGASGLEAYASFDYGRYDLNPLGQNAGIESDTYAATVGLEHILNSNLAVGLGFTHVENDNNLSGGLGTADIEGNAISTYASYFKDNLWADLLYSQGWYDANINRNTGLGSTVTASPDIVAHQTTLNLGYNIPHQNNVVHGPTFRTDYSWGKLQGYTESGDPRANAVFQEQDYESLITTLGWQINWKQDIKGGSLLPQLRLGYGRENMNRETKVRGTLQNSPIAFVQGGNIIGTGGTITNGITREDPGEGWMEFGAGVGFEFDNNFFLSLDYQGRFFQQDAEQHIGTIRGGWHF